MDFRIEMVIFHSYVSPYQRVIMNLNFAACINTTKVAAMIPHAGFSDATRWKEILFLETDSEAGT